MYDRRDLAIKALILAAGYGTRLGELTKNKPKPLITIGRKPIVELIIDRLRIHGVEDIVINFHYLPDMLPEKLKSKAVYYYEPKLLGHNGTIQALKSWLSGDDFFVINGDTYSEVDYTAMMVSHTHNTITVFMDEWRCAGTWLYCKHYFDKPLLVDPYRPKVKWFDIGTPQRLQKARKYVNKRTHTV